MGLDASRFEYEQLRVAVIFFLIFSVIASSVEVFFLPSRLSHLCIAAALYLVVCALGLYVAHRWKRAARTATTLTTIALVPCMAYYQAAAGNVPTIAALPLILYCTAAAVIVPRLSRQVLVCASVQLTLLLLDYPLDTPESVYLALIVAGTGAITIPIAARLEAQQYETWRRVNGPPLNGAQR